MMRARYGMSFVSPGSVSCSVPIGTVVNTILDRIIMTSDCMLFKKIMWNHFCKPITTLSVWHILLHSWLPRPLGKWGLVLLHVTRQHSPGWCGDSKCTAPLLTRGCFTGASLCPLEVCVVRRSYFLEEFQAGTLYVCPRACFGHARGISVWGSHRRGDFRPCCICELIFGELTRC